MRAESVPNEGGQQVMLDNVAKEAQVLAELRELREKGYGRLVIHLHYHPIKLL